MFHKLWELWRFQTAKVTFKVIQGHWRWCHTIGYIRFPISLPLHLSHHLSPVDCRILGMMQAHLYQTPVRNVTDLRQRLIDTWMILSQSNVDDAADKRRPVWTKNEDIMNTCCNWTWIRTGCADKLDVVVQL